MGPKKQTVRPEPIHSRRQLLKVSALAATTLGVLPLLRPALAQSTAKIKPVAPVDIRFAGYPVDHVQALVDGRVEVENCNVTFESGKIGDLNTLAFEGAQTYAVTEIGLSPYMLAYANQGFRDYSLIPVFPIRLFRHKSIFVNSDRGIINPEELKGKRVGTPAYSSTSLTWIRGFMQHEYGVKPEDVEWVVSALDSSAKDAGKISKQENIQPEGISIAIGPEGKDESDMLIDGDVDALFHAGEPRAFTEGHPKIKRLFGDYRAIERDYFARTGIFPIMHAVAIRNDIASQYPWLIEAVFNAYSQAKQLQYDDMSKNWIFGTLPWFGKELENTKRLMGGNFWPYGIEPNMKTLEALFQYSYEQGLASKQLTVEELFHPASMDLVENFRVSHV